MNRKTIKYETVEQLSVFWAMKVIDLDRTIKALREKMLTAKLEDRFRINREICDNKFYQSLIDSLLKKYRRNEF